MQKFDSYKINEILEHKFYQIPQELFTNPIYKDKLSLEAKMLYSFVLDRLTLSKKHNWINEDGDIYLIFTRNEASEKLCLSNKTTIKAFKELISVELLRETRQGLGRPNLIFVGKIQHEPINTEVENLHLQTCKNYTSENVNNTFPNMENLHTINTNNNHTNIINTNSINPKSEDELSLERVKELCKLDEFEGKDKTILEDVIDTLYNSPTVKIGAVNLNHLKILSRLELITKENLEYVLEVLKDTPNIKNTTKYLIPCLYNKLGTSSTSHNKKEQIPNKSNGREYTADFFDKLESLYANIPRKDCVT